MPSAVMTTVLANEYNLDASLVTAIVFAGTILSPLTLHLCLLPRAVKNHFVRLEASGP